MVQPLIITKQEMRTDSKVRLHFTINKPGVFEYVPEYCAYTLDNGGTWYKMREVRKHGHDDDPLFVPQGGQSFMYVFQAPSQDDVDAVGSLYPEIVTRLTVTEKDCLSGPPSDAPSYMDPTDPTTGNEPPITGQPPITGEPPEIGDPGDPGGPSGAGPGPVNKGGEVPTGGGPGDIGPGEPDAPSPGTPTTGPDAPLDGPDSIPPGTNYPGYPGGPDDHADAPTGAPNDPTPPTVPVQPIPGDETDPTVPDQGPEGGILDPRPNDPGDTPTAPPGGFNPAPPVPTNPDGEGGPEIPTPGPTEAPTTGPVTDGSTLPEIPLVQPPGIPGGSGDLPVPPPSGLVIDPLPAQPLPAGEGSATLPPEYPDNAIDPMAPKPADGNVEGLPVDPMPIVYNATPGVPVDGGTNAAFPHEVNGSPATALTPPDMGLPGTPVIEVPPGNPSGVNVEVYAIPREVYADTNSVVITTRVVNDSYGSNLSEASLTLEFIAPDGRPVHLGSSYRFNLPEGHYYSISTVVPAHALWPPGAAHVHAILLSHGNPIGDAVNILHIMNLSPQDAV